MNQRASRSACVVLRSYQLMTLQQKEITMKIRNVISGERRGPIAAACLVVCCVSGVFARSPSIFAPGDILVSRTTYTGTASTVPFPGPFAEQQCIRSER